MSNTSYVSPYDQVAADNSVVSAAATGASIAIAGATAAAVTAAVSGAIGVVQWLAEESPEDKAAVERATEERRRALVESALTRNHCANVRGEAPLLSSIGLHVRQPESLIRSAER